MRSRALKEEILPALKAETQTLLERAQDRKSTRLNSSHLVISYAVFCLKKNMYRGARTVHGGACGRLVRVHALYASPTGMSQLCGDGAVGHGSERRVSPARACLRRLRHG